MVAKERSIKVLFGVVLYIFTLQMLHCINKCLRRALTSMGILRVRTKETTATREQSYTRKQKSNRKGKLYKHHTRTLPFVLSSEIHPMSALCRPSRTNWNPSLKWKRYKDLGMTQKIIKKEPLPILNCLGIHTSLTHTIQEKDV